MQARERWRVLGCFLICVTLLFTAPSLASDWVKHAERLTGESEGVRNRAIRKLKRIKGLEGELTLALTGPDKFLAVDVIATLRLKPLLPLLIDLSPVDETGVIYLAMNVMMDEDNVQDLTNMYRKRLIEEEFLSVPAKMVILDTLGRIGYQLPPKDLNQLFSDGPFEIQNAVVYYIRLLLMKKPDLYGKYQQFLRSGLRREPYQLRLRVLHTIKDLPEDIQTQFSKNLKACLKDKNQTVKQLCGKLQDKVS